MSRHIAELIAKLKVQLKLTSIVVTHDTRLARQLGDRIMVLADGHAIFFGTPAELANSKEPFIREFLAEDEFAPVVK